MLDGPQTLSVSIWRGTGTTGAFQGFEVPRQGSQTVLDVVSWIQQNLDPTLTYRYACRVGMCGSCAMMVNGVPRWTCRTHVNKVDQGGALTIGPLRNLPVIKDLAADMDPFFEKWVKAEGSSTPPARATRKWRGSIPLPRRGAPPTGPSNASTARSAMPPATPWRATRIISGPPPSTAPGAW